MLNKIILIGRVGRDPEVRYLPNGEAAASLSLATSEKWKNQRGEVQEHTEWHNIAAYGKLAEIIGQWLKKGALVYFEGKIRSRKYADKNGIERTVYEVVASEMKMLGSKNEDGKAAAPEAAGEDAPF